MSAPPGSSDGDRARRQPTGPATSSVACAVRRQMDDDNGDTHLQAGKNGRRRTAPDIAAEAEVRRLRTQHTPDLDRKSLLASAKGRSWHRPTPRCPVEALREARDRLHNAGRTRRVRRVDRTASSLMGGGGDGDGDRLHRSAVHVAAISLALRGRMPAVVGLLHGLRRRLTSRCRRSCAVELRSPSRRPTTTPSARRSPTEGAGLRRGTPGRDGATYEVEVETVSTLVPSAHHPPMRRSSRPASDASRPSCPSPAWKGTSRDRRTTRAAVRSRSSPSFAGCAVTVRHDDKRHPSSTSTSGWGGGGS